MAKMEKSRWFALRAMALAFASVLGSGVAAAAPQPWEAQLTETIQPGMSKASVPGVIIGVWQVGVDPYVRAFGVRDRATGQPMATDLAMRIGSVTKTFVTTAILQLVDQGKVGLDDPVSKYVSGVPNGDVTIRQLAAMRSGLYDYSDATEASIFADPYRQYTPQDLLELIGQGEPVFPPDDRFEYNNTNTVLLGLVVERATGQSLEDYIDQHILQPEGLKRTVFPKDATLPSPHANGYAPMPDGKVVDATDWNPSWGWAAGQMASTVEDMGVWAHALATGKLLTPATQTEREQFLPAPSEGDGSLYGLGVENENGWIGHNGNIKGYQTYVYYLPSKKMTMVVMLNSSVSAVGVWNFVTDIVKVIAPDHPWPGPPKG